MKNVRQFMGLMIAATILLAAGYGVRPQAVAQGDNPGDQQFQRDQPTGPAAGGNAGSGNAAGGNAAQNPAAGAAGNAAGNASTPAAPVVPQPPVTPTSLLMGMGGVNVATRSSTENEVTSQTKRWGVEVLRDPFNGGTVYMSESGDLAASSTTATFGVRSVQLVAGGAPEMVRFNAQSGETWLLIGGANWKKLEEKGTSPGRGDYEVNLFSGGANSFFCYRVDQVSGRGWRLEAGVWVDILEPQ